MTRILLVDDNAGVRRSMRDVLGAAFSGAAVGEASDARTALAALDRERWDLVVLDLSLPDRSGLDALRDIHRLHPALPVVVMSFNSEAEYAAAARAAGAVGYIAKGSSPDAIVSAVAAALSTTPGS
jgi:two-component system, NarL family, invasion response regulator UvrY